MHIEKLSRRRCLRADGDCLLRGDDLAATCVIERKLVPAKTVPAKTLEEPN
jgi:hypothetical protein